MTSQTQSPAPAVISIGGEEKVRVGESLTTLALRRLRRDKLTLVAMSVILVLAVLSFAAPLIERYVLNVDYTSTNIDKAFLTIGAEGHILGTDDVGRDHLARLLYAGQISLSIAFISAILSLIIGVTLGVITGYYGGIVDDIVNWLITTLDSIPSLFLLIIVSGVVLRSRDLSGTIFTGPFALVLILGFLGWSGITRLVRGETLSIREREYIISARAIGSSPIRIMFTHIIPNLLSVVFITLAIDIGSLILVESALSFLGFGVRPPAASWGNMLTNANSYFTKGPHLVVAPGLLIVVTVLCLYVIGDGLRDAFDPTSID
ncbi:MAG: ABC transporter permease [Chloroflexi bacterium]|nr:ABC transporter permease [Chloroflexota bacterium]MCC6893802.1 ABC transporter permease [Anaerolineae bacterium]